MNKVDCSSEYLGQLWAGVWSEIGAEPVTGTGTSRALDPETEAKKRKATIFAIAGALKFTLNKYVPGWEITPEEIRELSEAYADLVLWAFPDTGVTGLLAWWEERMEKYGPLVVAIQVTGKVVGARLAAAYLPDLVDSGEQKQEMETADDE